MDIIEACRTGDIEMVKALLEAETDVNVKNLGGHTALMWAAAKGHVEITNLLLEYGANTDDVNVLNKSALHFACCRSHFKIVKELLKRNANTNSKCRGETPLVSAINGKHYHLVVLFHKFNHLLEEKEKQLLDKKTYKCCFNKRELIG